MFPRVHQLGHVLLSGFFLFLFLFSIKKESNVFYSYYVDVFHELFDFPWGNQRFLSACNKCLWMALLTPIVLVIRGMTFQPLVLIAWMSGLYLLEFSA